MKAMTYRTAMDMAKENAIYTLRNLSAAEHRKGNVARAQELRARALYLETGKEAPNVTPTLD